MPVNFKKTKLIKIYFGDVVKEYGFEYGGASAWTWHFIRHKEGVGQEIIIMRHRFFPDQVKLLFNTDAPGWGDQEPRNFAEPYKYKEFWKFESREEYIAVLQEFVEIVRTYGLEMLEKMSSPKDPIYATPEMNRYLYESYESLVDGIHAKYHFDKTGVEGVEEITRKLYENRDREFEEAKDFLIEMAVLYTKILENDVGGILTYEDNLFQLENNGRNYLSAFPLMDIVIMWREFHRGRNMEISNLMLIGYKQLMVSYL